MAAGYRAYTGRSSGGSGADSPRGAGRGGSGSRPAPADAAPSEDEVREAEVALGRALHALHRTAGANPARLLVPCVSWHDYVHQLVSQALETVGWLNLSRLVATWRSSKKCLTYVSKLAYMHTQSCDLLSAGAIVADQLGPGKLRGVPPEWGAFAALAALIATALHPVYRQVLLLKRCISVGLVPSPGCHQNGCSISNAPQCATDIWWLSNPPGKRTKTAAVLLPCIVQHSFAPLVL